MPDEPISTADLLRRSYQQQRDHWIHILDEEFLDTFQAVQSPTQGEPVMPEISTPAAIPPLARDRCTLDHGDSSCTNSRCRIHGPEAGDHRTHRLGYQVTLRQYSADASKIIGFIPKRGAIPDVINEVSSSLTQRKLLELLTKISASPSKNPVKSAYYGVELEVYARKGVTQFLTKMHEVMGEQPWMIFKKDGSLGAHSHGIEIATAPMTLSEHQKRWPLIQEVLRKEAFGWGESTCGLHVHISRGDDRYCWALSKLEIQKMCHFIHCWKNTSFLEALGGRRGNNYCTFSTGKVLFKKRDARGERNEAINLHKNETLELRFFQSTTKVMRILMAVEFAACLREFASEVSIAECSDMNKFIAIARKNAKRFPNLVVYLDYVLSKSNQLQHIEETPLTDEIKATLEKVMNEPLLPSLSFLVPALSNLSRFEDYARDQFGSRAVVAKIIQLKKAVAKAKGE